MKLPTEVRDSLYLTWALATEDLPEPPRPLRYQTHLWEERRFTFVSVVLSRQEGLAVPVLPFLTLSHPQLNLLTYVLDGAGEPAVLLRQILVPGWLAPGMRLLTGLPVRSAGFDLPRPSPAETDGEAWRWWVRGEGELAVSARPGGPRIGEGPRFPSWEALVRSLRSRSAIYVEGPGGLRRLNLIAEAGQAVPLVAEVEEAGLLEGLLPLAGGDPWPPLYAAWLDPQVSVAFQVGPELQPALPRGVPAPG